ncbi:transcription initiation factor TFIID subunit 8-like [Diospyros lotus]|uniref:transcription initiation factor TFIID subunit 8-like n=1 Tax=Diospyros lotus TaxID=55363 RepID=UPI00225B1CBE|nr:transcription initiation factor TFIID subunit 8-like [Diospyros lotus]XP_052195907.1 transcription initiation factor TFIID subunit 8-like [Diospyros lotus]XP_052195908.1 transcription initiation factor TFIID subunit 8-like [Diospyros lotus]XP_052195909.1 transcription initiation factor TFIID subunit 8-like [Diospyros lotus]XP_052195910.1 transcription initiation factor TFIID subunit 8-like [Diospyros lotus]XP_052195911.1 transcription initiation factor TFIID subunit 8-like [Diospyros lotus]
MSDGGGESVRDYGLRKAWKKSGTDDFGQAVAMIAVAQVCESAGFQGFQQSALGTLSDVAVRYIREIGKIASTSANSAGRRDSNVFDIIQGLEDLGFSIGFPGASETNRCVAGSGMVQEIAQYVSETEQVPFAYSIPSFPVIKDRKQSLSFAQVGETPPSDHIPSWLPAFPDPQTYSHPPSRDEKDVYSHREEVDNMNDRRKVERSLLNLQQRLACNGSELPTASDPGDVAKAKQAAEANPFLAAPLRFGEKEVSSVVFPLKSLNEATAKNSMVLQNHGSALQIFSLGTEAMESMLSESGDSRENAIPNNRPGVQFKIASGKRSSGTSMSCRNDEINFWFGENDESNDKKRRAEQILKESMENTQELDQL